MKAAMAPQKVRKKQLGAFYTPQPIAEALVEWAVRSPGDHVFDPSFGGLVVLEAAQRRLIELGAKPGSAVHQLHGCDLDEEAHALATARAGIGIPSSSLLHRDFFEITPGDHLPRVQAVCGNPPYVRYQGFNGAGQRGHRIAEAAGLRLTRLSSSWAPFLIHSAAFVAPGGRLALVLPAELLHAQYATGVLGFIRRNFTRIALVLFEERVFPDALEEVVLLFAEGRDEDQSSEVRLMNFRSLDDLDLTAINRRLATARSGEKEQPDASKPLAQLLPRATADLYARLSDSKEIRPLGEAASVDIGAVTGANDFFLLAQGEGHAMHEELLRPAISKAVHVRGARFSDQDLERLAAKGTRFRLFVADESIPDDVLSTAQSYLRRGRRQGIHTRYKCRVRHPWWAVPLPTHGVPDLFMTYCSSEHPRLVVNEARALHTNTVHGVTLKNEAPAAALAAGFFNSLTMLSAELVGRSYGGGVLKHEPTEAEALLIPPIPAEAVELLEPVDEFLRARDLNAALDAVDPLLLGGLGLSRRDQVRLRAGADKLRGRRRARGRTPRVVR